MGSTSSLTPPVSLYHEELSDEKRPTNGSDLVKQEDLTVKSPTVEVDIKDEFNVKEEKPQLYDETSETLSSTQSISNDSKFDQKRCNSQVLGYLSKFDKVARLAIILGTIAILLPVGFLPFLWTAHSSNSAWHWIVSHDHLHTVVVALAGCIETGFTAQTAVIVAMVAAVLLESGQVSLGDSAPFSVARNVSSASSVLPLLRRQIMNKASPRFSGLGFFVPLTALLIFIFTQLVSVILVSDLGVAAVPGFKETFRTMYSIERPTFLWGSAWRSWQLNFGEGSMNYWTKTPTSYYTFAEYSEDPVELEGVSDTGVTLRAFLPFQSQLTRQNLHSYRGSALVMDSRITCQVPDLQDFSITRHSGGELSLSVSGLVGASRPTPRLNNETIRSVPLSPDQPGPFVYNHSIPFDCRMAFWGSSGRSNRWRATICQLPQGPFIWEDSNFQISGGLTSEFQNPPQYQNWSDWHRLLANSLGTAYLVFNVTTGTKDEWLQLVRSEAGTSHTVHNDSVTWLYPNDTRTRDEWNDAMFSYDEKMLTLSTSICYSSLVTARVPVVMSSSENRTEPYPAFNLSSYTWDNKRVRRMLGQFGGDAADRGVLQLQNQGSWVVMDSEEDHFQYESQDFMHMYMAIGHQDAPQSMEGYYGNVSMPLWANLDVSSPDPVYTQLFQDIVGTGGSLPFALQSLFTVLASTVYYDFLPLFDIGANVTRSEYVSSNIAITYKGLSIVLVAIIVHFCLLGTVLWMFLTRTKYSTIGETWKAVSQVHGPTTEDLIARASDENEVVVKQRLVRQGQQKTRIKIDYIEKLDRIGVVEVSPAKHDLV